MSDLTHTFTQTHRHFISSLNQVTVDVARRNLYPLIADCGQVWIPHYEHQTAALPMCRDCEGVASGKPSRIPDRAHFVYRCFDKDGRLAYVGCSVAPRTRMDQHRASSWWFEQVASIRYTVFPSRSYALYMERVAIETENPRWNIRHRVRDGWSLADYRDFHTAMTFNSASEKRLERIRSEASSLFGVDITDPRGEATA